MMLKTLPGEHGMDTVAGANQGACVLDHNPRCTDCTQTLQTMLLWFTYEVLLPLFTAACQ